MTVLKTYFSYFINAFVLYPFQLYFALWVFPPLAGVENLPTFAGFVLQFLIMILIEDFASYWIHRMFHTPLLYKFHKQHHSQSDTTMVSAANDHWIDYSVVVNVPFLSGLFLLHNYIHIATLNVFLIFHVWIIMEVHCGYESSWNFFASFPFLVNTTYHSYHHTHNIGNYSAYLTIWDTLFKTNKDFYEYVKEKKEK